MTLEQQLLEWDGKSADAIKAIYTKHSKNNRLLDLLIGLISVEPLQKGATWLIKHALEDGQSLNLSQQEKIINSLKNLPHWESRLHFLQLLDQFTVEDQQVMQIEAFLRANLTSKNKFVRAWTYSGFYTLAQKHPQYAEEVDLMLMDAMMNESGSIRARIRNLKK